MFEIASNQFDGEVFLRDHEGAFLSYELEENSIELNREGGNWLDSNKTFVVPKDEWTKIRISAIGSNIDIFINGNVFTSTLSDNQNLPSGSIAIGASPNAKVCFDNIKVFSVNN
ncbi:family 16 glycoside hydrolase [Ornatilinea apprima]|uniref:family 16 glycoside hydrolase n=1 Tax=Ornatilinea apprima TaxID=1134406 RepID=UPI00128F9293